ncbi:MAG: efflux RND transporter periplasmic adaptor subunit [Pirellulales bacterium]
MNEAKLNIEYCTIKAPVSGRIGLRTVDQGNMIRSSEQTGMAVITQLHPINVTFSVPQDSIGAVRKHLNAGETMTVDAYDRGFVNKLDSGRLSAIDNLVDPGTGTVRLKGYFENTDRMLYPNQFVNARLASSNAARRGVGPFGRGANRTLGRIRVCRQACFQRRIAGRTAKGRLRSRRRGYDVDRKRTDAGRVGGDRRGRQAASQRQGDHPQAGRRDEKIERVLGRFAHKPKDGA